MSYTKTTWSDGDIITANKMNNIETGVESLNTDVGQLQTDLDSLTETVKNLPTGGGDVPADYQELVDDVADIKADLNQIIKNNIFTSKISFTNTNTETKRKCTLYPFVPGERYIVELKVNEIPAQHGNTHIALASASNASGGASSKVEAITPDLKNIEKGFSAKYIFEPTANALYFYVYTSTEVGEIDIDVNIEVLTTINNDSVIYKRVASITRFSGSAQRNRYSFRMIAGKEYNLKVFMNCINATKSTGGKSICVISAINEDASIRDSILGIRTLQGNSDLIPFGKWNKYKYTALHDTEYIELYIAECDEGSSAIVEVNDTDCSLPEYAYNELSIKNHGNRMIYDTKPYPFKRIGGYTGSGQSVVERNGEIYVFTNGTMYKYVDFSVKSTSSLFLHPINASLMENGNILISDITGYNTAEEVRHVYEYNPDTDNIINDYVPTVSEKHLVLSEEIDSSTLLVAYKDDNETERIIYWYSYDFESGNITAISQTAHDRVYTQGCSLRGGLVYVMTNSISTSINSPAKVIVVELATGEILNEIILREFGETEGFYISYSQGLGTYVFTLDNSDKGIYLIKLV